MNTSLPTTAERPRSYRWLLLSVLVVVAALFFGWPHMKGRYQRWNVARQVKSAAAFLAEGEYKRAIVSARGVLESSPMDGDAIAIMAKALDALESPSAVSWLSHVNSLRPEDTENTIAWALASLRTGDFATAGDILQTLKPGQPETARFHFAAAKIAMARRDAAGAAQHWAEACRLKPADDGYRLALATIRLGSKRVDEHQAAVEVLSEIGRKPPLSIQALRALIEDAIARAEWKRAAELADLLIADPGAGFEDKLRRLGALRAMKSGAASEYLLNLRDQALEKPADLYMLLLWMTQHDLSLMVTEWARTLPPDFVGTPPVSVAVADAYLRTSEWTKLEQFLNEHAWGDLEYMRRIFLSVALERQGEGERSAQEWQDALAAARSREDTRQRLERIAKTTISWKWNQRAEEVMWILTTYPECPRWVLDGLWGVCLGRSDAVQLQKISGILAQAESKSVVFRDNYAFFSLLIRSEEGDPHREAERLFKENPANPNVAMTRALSLYQQGKFAEALAVTSGLPPAELKNPQAALYHAIFLIAAGEDAKAAEFLAVAEGRTMFPEEVTLLKMAKLRAGKGEDESRVAETAKAMRAAKAAKDAGEEKEIAEATKAMRAAKAAKEAAEEKEIAEATKAARAARAAMDAEKEKAVEEARAARAAKAAKETAEQQAAKKDPLLRLTPK